MPHCTRFSALLLVAALALAGDAPTDEEWSPIAKALAAGSSDALASAEALSARYPKWPDGYRVLANARLRAGDATGAWKAARAALGLSKTDHVAGALGVQALAMLNRYDDAYKVAEGFSDRTDVNGEVAAQAAFAALQARNDKRVSDFIAMAKARATGATPVLDFVTAKLSQRGKNLPAAAAALDRAIAAKPDYRDALYELGRVRTVQAMQTPDQATDLLSKAETAFASASKLDLRDADIRFGLGRARLELGKRLLSDGKKDEGQAMLRQALTAFDEGLQLEAGNRDGKLWKGDALLRLERYDEAAPLLSQAFAAGAIDRALPFNLSLALQRSGKPAEAAKVLENVEARNNSERLTLAINAFGLGNWAKAQELFTDVLSELPTDTPEEAKQRWATCRYIGHCNREQAATATGEAREEFLATAANFYKEAGDNGDFVARHWYLHLQAPRGPQEAFKAGQQSMKWNGFWTPSAWKLMAANYGWKVSRGEGVAGALKHSPAHLMLWSLLAIIPVGLFLKGWLLPGGLYGNAKPRPAGKPATRSASKPGVSGPRRSPGAAVSARKPGAKPPSRALAPKDGTGPKTPFSE